MDNDALITRFLLGDLGPADRQRIEERLATDPTYFEAVAAFEDDLILKWHRGELTDDEQRLFVSSYSSPSRQARVKAGGQLIAVAQRWDTDTAEGWSPWKLLSQWRTTSWNAARFATAGAMGLLIAAAAVALFVSNDGIRQPAPRLTVAFTLAPVGDRSTTGTANLVSIPQAAENVSLQFEVADLAAADGLDAMVDSLTGAIVAAGSPVRVTRGADSSHVTLTVPSSDLADGDYVLRLRQASPAGGHVIIATRAFRVMHI
jgi:anti-sigma factor RsiW